jgi:uncharacterized membrane protein YhaH (DUF805 family)
MTFTQAIKSGFSNYVNFTGRSSRSAFWYWVLFAFIVGVAADTVDISTAPDDLMSSSFLASRLWSLVTLLPNLAVGARRLHDTGRSGFWLFLSLLPIIGIIVLIVWWASKGTSGPNKYGADPLATA